MIDSPTDRMPTEAELELWQFDLAKRILRLGRDFPARMAEQARTAVSELVDDGQDRQG